MFAVHFSIKEPVVQLVWYDALKDRIFLSGYADHCFYGLIPVDWERFEVIGVL